MWCSHNNAGILHNYKVTTSNMNKHRFSNNVNLIKSFYDELFIHLQFLCGIVEAKHERGDITKPKWRKLSKYV